MGLKLRIDFSLAVSAIYAITSFIAFWIFSELFEEALILYFGTPFSICIFFFFYQLLSPDNKTVTLRLKSSIFNYILYFFTIISILLVLFVPSYEGSMLQWMNTPMLNWLRYLSSLLLTSFLPGHFFLRILDRKNAITGSVTIVLSYLLSLFITFIVGFLILLSGNTISSLGSLSIILATLFLIFVFHINSHKKTEDRLLTIDPVKVSFVLSVFLAIEAAAIIVMINNLPLTSGDMQRHHGFALQFLDRFPVYGGKLIGYAGYLFHIYLAMLFTLSGIPSTLVEQGLYVFSFMPILAFYSLIKAWFNEDYDGKLSLIAVMLSVLLGFGGLYALYLKLAEPAYHDVTQLLTIVTSKTYDIYMRVLYLPDIVAPLWNIGLPTFFMLLLFIEKRMPRLIKTTLIPILVALGYLGHISEIVIFVLVTFIYKLFSFRRGDGEKIGAYILLGLSMVALLDLIAPTHHYIFLSNIGKVLSYTISVLLTTLICIIELVKGKHTLHFSLKNKSFNSKKLEVGWRYARWLLLYIYIFLFIIWFTIERDFDLWKWGGYSFTPFFVFPLRIGHIGLLAIASLFIHFSKIIKDRRLFFFLLLIPTGLMLEQMANYYLPYYPAYKYATLSFIGACIISAYGVVKVADRATKAASSPVKRNIVLCTLLSIIMISGLLSTTLYYVNASYYSRYKISQEELNALHYVRQNVTTNSSILAFTEESANKLRNFAGINPVQDAQRWSKLLLSASNPYVITYILGSSNVKYIYLSQEDIKLLSSNSVLKSFIEHFRKVFENDYVTVYEVPPLIPPSSNASLGVFHFYLPTQKLEDTSWVEDSFTEGWRPYRQWGKVKHYESKVENGIMEITVISNQSGNVWASYTFTDLAFNTSTYSTLAFRYRVENDLTWFTLQLWNSSNKVFFYAGHLTDRTFTTKLYSLPDNQIVTRVEIIVETTDKAPAGTSAIAYLDYIEISQWAFTEDDVFPALFTASLQSRYSFIYVDSTLMKNINAYISHYTHILLTSDPPLPIEGLVDWVSAGGNLIVFNTHGNGFFSDLLGINSSSPFLSTRKLGLGKVLYINLEVGEKSELLKPEFIEKIKEDLTLDKYVHKVDTLPVYNSTFGSIEIDGNLNLSTDVLKIQAHAINLAGMPFQLNGSAEILVYGRVTLTINNTSLLISPLESYLMVKPEGYHVEGEVLIEGNNSLIIVVDTNAVYSFNTPISFEFKAAGASTYARLPSISASGIIIFDQLDVHEALYVPLAGIVQQKAEVQGNVKFSTMYISSPLIMFSTFQAEGETLNLAETASRRSIPWFNVLTSPHNIIFNTIFLLGITICTVKKRIRRRS